MDDSHNESIFSAMNRHALRSFLRSIEAIQSDLDRIHFRDEVPHSHCIMMKLMPNALKFVIFCDAVDVQFLHFCSYFRNRRKV